MKLLNPFPLSGEVPAEHFCNRRNEIEALTRAQTSGVNVTLVSLRRMGKSALIHHVFRKRRKRGVACVYVDVYAATSHAEFVQSFASAVVRQAFGPWRTASKQAMEFVKSIRAALHVSADGIPKVVFDSHFGKRADSLSEIVASLEGLKNGVVVAFDEFQQVATFSDAATETLVRSAMQHSSIRCIFAGSEQRQIGRMFADPGRPLYASTEHLHLGAIERGEYRTFVEERLAKNNVVLDDDAFDDIYDRCEARTFHIQSVANRLYDSGLRRVRRAEVNSFIDTIISSHEHLYYAQRRLLTPAQWNLVEAVARERRVNEPLSEQFRQANGLGAASSVKRSLDALLDRSVVYHADGAYAIEDPFLAEWIRLKQKEL